MIGLTDYSNLSGEVIYLCPILTCKWEHKPQMVEKLEPSLTEKFFERHLNTHTYVDFLRTIQTQRNEIDLLKGRNRRIGEILDDAQYR